jgi:hypothetical protein
MNRSISLHPLSLVLGVVFAGICFLSMSQVWPAGQHVIVGYGPEPRDMVQIHEGTSYTVPAGRLFVLTGLGSGNFCTSPCALAVNGIHEASIGQSYNSGLFTGQSVQAVPPGFTAAPGSIIDVTDGCASADDARAWGYLAPQ